MKNNFIVISAVSLVLAGCWTIRETEYPTVSVPRVPAGKTVTVTISKNWNRIYAKENGMPTYQYVKGHEKFSSGNMSDIDALKKVTLMKPEQSGLVRHPQFRLLGRVIAELLDKGYTVTREKAPYVLAFSYEQKEPLYGALSQFCMSLSHLGTAGWNDATWASTVTVYDETETKVLFTKSYEQTYETKVWGPIPIGSPACHDMMTECAANSWVWTALVDRMLADATTFILSQQ